MNQVTSSCYAASKINKPFLGIYSACASNVEGLIIGSNFINSGIINNCLCGTSSHNMSSEKQFRNLFTKAGKLEGKHGENFLFLLESRLDNLVYRMGFATTRRQARQLVNHGHVLVDGKKVDIPSYIVKPGQTVEMKEASRNLQIVKEALENCVARLGFVSFDESKGVGTYVRLPQRNEILPEIRENLIVEFYNR